MSTNALRPARKDRTHYLYLAVIAAVLLRRGSGSGSRERSRELEEQRRRRR